MAEKNTYKFKSKKYEEKKQPTNKHARIVSNAIANNEMGNEKFLPYFVCVRFFLFYCCGYRLFPSL